jgi:hypothetical protein
VERVIALAEHCSASGYVATHMEIWLTQRAIVAWVLALGAGAVVWVATNAAHVIVRHVPPPGRDGVPLLDRHLHRVSNAAFRRKSCRAAGRVEMVHKQTCRGVRGNRRAKPAAPSPLLLYAAIHAKVVTIHISPVIGRVSPRANIKCDDQFESSNLSSLQRCASKGRETNQGVRHPPQARATWPYAKSYPCMIRSS